MKLITDKELLTQAEEEVLKKAEEMEKRTGLDWRLCCYLASRYVEKKLAKLNITI